MPCGPRSGSPTAACCSAPTRTARSSGSPATRSKKLVVARRRDRGGLARADQRRRGVGRRDARQQAVEDRRRGRQGDRRSATLKDVETIWSLAAAGNTVYAGTGPSGKLFAIKGGTAQRGVRHRRQAHHRARRSPATARCGWARSERALVFRYDPKDGKTRAMADFAGNEVIALAPYRDGVVAAANDLAEHAAADRQDRRAGRGRREAERAEGPGREDARRRHQARRRQGSAAGDRPRPQGREEGQGRAVPDRRRRPARSAARADRDVLHRRSPSAPTASVYAGAADKGRVYMVDGERRGRAPRSTSTSARSRSCGSEKSRLGVRHRRRRRALPRHRPRRRRRGTSATCSTPRRSSRFGKLTWVAQGKVKIETRSGNTAKPGVGWSEWQAPQQIGKLGGGVEGGKIASPPGRYLQFRIALDDDDARVRRVMAYYVPQNQATSVAGGHGRAGDQGEPADAQGLGRQAAQPGAQAQVEGREPRQRRHDLHARGAPRRRGELAPDLDRQGAADRDDVGVEHRDLSRRLVPLRVTASDAAANSPDRALTSSQTTTMFAIDNTRPAIDKPDGHLSARRPARASDALSARSPRWRSPSTTARGSSARPRDGLFDDRTEDLRIDLPAGPRARHAHARGPRRRRGRQRRLDVGDVRDQVAQRILGLGTPHGRASPVEPGRALVGR